MMRVRVDTWGLLLFAFTFVVIQAALNGRIQVPMAIVAIAGSAVLFVTVRVLQEGTRA